MSKSTTTNDTLLIGKGSTHILEAEMKAPNAGAKFIIRAGHIELDVDNMPTAYDSTNHNRIWLDGAGTASGTNKGGVLRIGPVTDGTEGNGEVNSQLQCKYDSVTYIDDTSFTQTA